MIVKEASHEPKEPPIKKWKAGDILERVGTSSVLSRFQIIVRYAHKLTVVALDDGLWFNEGYDDIGQLQKALAKRFTLYEGTLSISNEERQ